MPIEIRPTEVSRALGAIGRADRRRAEDAQVALDGIAWRDSDDDPLVVSRYDVQMFLWYRLTHKFIATPAELQEVAEALAAFFDEVGATSLAELCRSPETQRMIETDGDGWHELVVATGLEPPDTSLLRWGGLMSIEEAEVRDQAAEFLEGAVDRGELVPGADGWQECQVELMELFLVTPGLDGRSPLDLVHGGRVDGWVGHPSDSARRELLGEVRGLVEAPPPDDDAARLALAPLLWVLERLDAGVALTQTGAFSRQFVREAVERYPSWWPSTFSSAPNREFEVAPVEALHDIVVGLGLTRRRGRALYATKRSREVRNQPAALLSTLAAAFAADPNAPGDIDVAFAALLLEPPLARDAMEARVRAAVRVPDEIEGNELMARLFPQSLITYAMHIVAPFDGACFDDMRSPSLTPAGRVVATAILRASATASVRFFM